MEESSENVLFSKLSKNLVDLFSFLENSQEVFCKQVEKVRNNKSEELLNELEELIDGTFDELTSKHKEIRNFFTLLRQSYPFNKRSSNAELGESTFNGGHSTNVQDTTTISSNGFLSPANSANSCNLNGNINSVSTSKTKLINNTPLRDSNSNKKTNALNNLSLNSPTSSNHLFIDTEVGQSRDSVAINQELLDSIMCREIENDQNTNTAGNVLIESQPSVSNERNAQNLLAADRLSTSAKVCGTREEDSDVAKGLEFVHKFGVSSNCAVMVGPFDAKALIKNASQRSIARSQKDELTRLMASAQSILNNKVDLSLIGEESDEEESDSKDRGRPSSKKKKNIEKKINAEKLLKSSAPSKTQARAITEDKPEDDKIDNGVHSAANVADQSFCEAIDKEVKVEIKNEVEYEVRRPITRSRLNLEADKLLRKRVNLSESESELDGDDEFILIEENVNETSKQAASRKRVCSSSSENAILLDESDLNSEKSKSKTPDSDAFVRRKRKSASELSEGNKKRKVEKGKARRIAFDSDDSAAGSDDENHIDENESANNSSRCRKIMPKNKLSKSTIDAQKAERERKERLKQKQLEFNGIEVCENDESGELQMSLSDQSILAPKLKRLILDNDAKSTPSQPVQVDESLVSLLKPHQAEGIVFMYNSLFESMERLEMEDNFGGILAHCMGLGKTFQVIAFLHTIMMHPKLSKFCKHAVIFGPKNVVNNWAKEFRKWLFDVNPELDTISIYNFALYTKNEDRLKILQKWHSSKRPSILIISYEIFRILTESDEDRSKGAKKALKKTKAQKRLDKLKVDFRKYLQDPGPDLVICDEGHKLKSDDTGIFKTMSKIRTSRRLCLTGTPMQNNLDEYDRDSRVKRNHDYTMINFVKPGLLGTKQEFGNRFKNVILAGQTIDATPASVKQMKRRCYVLFDRLKDVVHRRDYRVLVQTIPPKQEYVIYVRMTARQCEIYRGFLKKYIYNDQLSMRKRLLPDYHIFARIWTHPFLLVLHERDVERRRVLTDDAEFVVSDEEEFEAEFTPSGSDSDVRAIDIPSTSTAVANRRSTRQNPTNIANSMVEEDEEQSGWYFDLNLVSKNDEFAFHLGNKLVLLQQIIKKCEEIGDKLLVFSQSLESIRMIRRMLDYLGSEGLWFVDGHKALGDEDGEWGWIYGIDYLIIDGSVGNKSRDYIQDQFNDPLNLRARLMLVSTLAGSLGTNLVTANRVVIFDACWNPSHDTQAMFRVYRYGQVKPVYIYRLIAQGTMEERIYKRQVTKESTARRVTDEAQIQRHFRGSDLYELYEFDPVVEDSSTGDHQSRLAPPKDRLLASVIVSHGNAIVNYIQHDSLFDEVEDEKLTEDERKEAWEDYELEENRPTTTMAYVTAVTTTTIASRMVLPNNSSILQQITNGWNSDNVYKSCFSLIGMTHEIAIRVLFIKRLMDHIMPHVPNDRRGGIHEFATYFVNIIMDTKQRSQTPLDLLERSITAFRTTTSIVGDVPKCKEVLSTIKTLAPSLFLSDKAFY